MIPHSQRERMVLVDASAFFASMDTTDQWHYQAVGGFERLARDRRPFCATSLIVAATHALLVERANPTLGLRWLESISRVPVFLQREEHYPRIRAILNRQRVAGFSYSDAFAFVVMDELGTRTAFSFDHHFRDHHFRQYGWNMWG